MRQSSEVVDERNILVHSQYRSRCLHSVVGRGVGPRHVASEEESGMFPMIMMDSGYGSGVDLCLESEPSQATGAVHESNLPLL